MNFQMAQKTDGIDFRFQMVNALKTDETESEFWIEFWFKNGNTLKIDETESGFWIDFRW